MPRPSIAAAMTRLLLLLLSLAAAAPVAAQTLAEQVLERTNLARWDNGRLPPLKGQAQLDVAAQLHSDNMATRNFFMHCDPDTRTQPWDRMIAAGYAWNAAAENIASGSGSAAGVMEQWLNSSGHRANILDPDYRELGIGYAHQANDASNVRYGNDCTVTSSSNPGFRHYWTQNFGSRGSVMPVVIAREAYRSTTCSVDLYVYGAGFASQMRFSNNGGATWSSWQAYRADAVWTLSGVSGSLATVSAQIRSAGGIVRSASDSIVLGANCGISVDPMRIFSSAFE